MQGIFPVSHCTSFRSTGEGSLAFDKKILTRLINHILIAGLNYCEKYLTFSSRKKKSTSKWGKWNIILNPLKVQKYRYTMEPCILRRSENVFLHLKIKPGKVL